jgi:hypothetical protein
MNITTPKQSILQTIIIMVVLLLGARVAKVVVV